MPVTSLFGAVSKTGPFQPSLIVNLFDQLVASRGDQSPIIAGYLPEGRLVTGTSKLEQRPVLSVMGSISLQRDYCGSESTRLLELPGGRTGFLMLDGTPRSFLKLVPKYRALSGKIDLHPRGSQADRDLEISFVEISSWSQEFSSGFVYAVSNGNRISVSRDTLGIRPLFLGESRNIVAFATDEPFLLGLALPEIRPLEPGGSASLSQEGVTYHEKTNLPSHEERKDTLHSSAEKVVNALTQVLSEELSGLENVGLAFSGGIDSSILARIVSKIGAVARLYTTGIPDSDDLLFAEKAADWLGLPFTEVPLSLDDAESNLMEIISLLETTNPVEISIALPIYVTQRSIRNDQLSVALSGQGADELFGGYHRYLLAFKEHGFRGFSRCAWDDLTGPCLRNAGREMKIARTNGIDLLLPYLDLDVLQVALRIPPELKILGPTDPLRKAVLRESGRQLNLPMEIVNRKKRAVQYSSGSMKIIRRLAKQRGYSVREYLDSLLENVPSD